MDPAIEAKSRGTKVSIKVDGDWNEALALAVNRIDTTRQAYVKEALKRRLVADGFLSPEARA
jgi:hypothetical protein